MVNLTQCEIRMVCLDLDGTLFTPQKKVSERSRKAIVACLDRGIEVILVTAGPYLFARRRRIIH